MAIALGSARGTSKSTLFVFGEVLNQVHQFKHMLQIDTAPVMLRHIELAFSDQYIGRSDMWRLQQSLRGTCVYSEKKILYAGLIKATVKRMFSKDGLVSIFVLQDTCIRLLLQHSLTSLLACT